MNGRTELTMNVNAIETEIMEYLKQKGDKAVILKIGRRLIHVRNNRLTQDFIGWYEGLGIKRRNVNEYIKVTEELGEDIFNYRQGALNTLYEVANIPKEERDKPHTIPNTGKIKLVKDMTAGEIKEVKKMLRQAQEGVEVPKKQICEVEIIQDVKPQTGTEGVKLSTDINVITAEIKHYKKAVGQAIFEIGRRLKHVKENDLVHGEWERWCKTEIDITPQYANRFIKVYEELGGNRNKSFDLKPLNVLYQIATMPEKERNRPHYIPSTGETKKPEDMSQKEIQEVKRGQKEKTKGSKTTVLVKPKDMPKKDTPEIIKPFLSLEDDVIKLLEKNVLDANTAWEVGKLSKQKQSTFIKIIEGMKHSINEDKRVLALILNSEYTESDVVNIYNTKVNADKLHTRAIYLSYLTEGDAREKLGQFIKLMKEINVGLFVVSAGINSSEKRDLIGLSKKINELIPQIKSLIEDIEAEAKKGNASKVFNISKRRSYDILGVSSEANQDEIKDRFRKLVKILHPDKGGDAKLFQLVTEAYEAITQ